TLGGTIRTLDHDVRERTIHHVRSLAEGIQQVTGTKIDVDFDHGSASVVNDEDLTKLIETVASDLLGAENVATITRPSMGSEDFAACLAHVPGSMFRLGAAGDNPPWPGLHTPMFDVDERCLAVGAKILARSVVEWSRTG